MNILIKERQRGLNRAFTLIELLIVVAIIAILAAIAIPNMLEAQVRARVAEARAAQRTLALALTAYRVDERAYPPAPIPFADPAAQAETWRLTTPVAYIQSIPRDGFFASPEFAGLGGPFGIGSPYQHYTDDPQVTEFWLVWSYGPDRDMEMAQVDYDPTNGTVSDGDIYRTGEPK